MSRPPITVVVADRRPLLADALARCVRQDASLQLQPGAGDGRSVLSAILRAPPDVALVGSDLEAITGERIAHVARREGLRTRVVIMADADLSVGYDAIRRGAAGVLSTSVSADEIRDAIHRVAEGEAVLCARAQTAMARTLRAREPGGEPELTAREREVLACVSEGMMTPAIARQLQIAPSTVQTHLKHLYERLGVSERAELVAQAMRRGLLE